MSDSDPPSNTLTDRVSNSVLETCKMIDPGAKIDVCFRNSSGRTTVELLAGPTHTAVELASALRNLLPLAFVKTSQNLMTGETTASIVVPTREDEYDIAHTLAATSRPAKIMRWLSAIAIVVALGWWFYTILSNTSTTLDDRDI